MKNTINYLNIIKRYSILSIKELIVFPFEFIMRLAFVGFEIGFIYIFWISIFNIGLSFKDWTTYEIIILVSMNLLSDGIGGITFGFRDLEYAIIDGTFDKHLMKPINPIFSMLMDKLNIFSIVIKICISSFLLLYISKVRGIILHNVPIAILLSIIGTMTFRMIYGSFSLLAFWFGKIYTARELIFSFQSAKDYPMDIFPVRIQNIFTYFIPLAYLSTIPAKILLNKIDNIYLYLTIIGILFIISIFIFNFVSKKAFTKYNSTGS